MHQIGMGQLLENIALGTNLGTYWVFLIKFSYIGLTEPTLRMLFKISQASKALWLYQTDVAQTLDKTWIGFIWGIFIQILVESLK